MRIYFERTGGFMGLSLQTAVDTAALSEEDAHHLQQMIDATEFFELPEELDGTGGTDAFNYTLTVETEERRHTIHTNDRSAPDTLQPLLHRLTLLARTHPPASDTASNTENGRSA